MRTEDFSQLVALCGDLVKQHARHVQFARLALLRIQNLERSARLAAGIAELPDGPEKRACSAELLRLAQRAADHEGEPALFDDLARAESEQERLEARLATLMGSAGS